jgi:hypothetical protein
MGGDVLYVMLELGIPFSVPSRDPIRRFSHHFWMNVQAINIDTSAESNPDIHTDLV